MELAGTRPETLCCNTGAVKVILQEIIKVSIYLLYTETHKHADWDHVVAVCNLQTLLVVKVYST